MKAGGRQSLSTLARIGFGASIAMAMLVVAGCTSVSRATTDAIRLAFKRQDITPTAQQVDAVPYPQLLLHSSDISGVLILGYVDEGRQAWMAGREAVLYLQSNGLLSGMSDSRRNSNVRVEGEDPFRNLARLEGPAKVQRRYDWMPGYHYDVPVTGELRRIGTESVTLPNRTLQLVRYEETLEGPGISGTNVYWADQNGFIWKSRQYLAPGQTVEIEQLKPYLPANS
ncbi:MULTISPECIES: YjbF family lipoprotein [Gammaproteobacteria]|uniref:YjbF family lipoprotein n=1 Tax=Gammaproteobacteria TaxID=1236 RepID=UPI0015B07E6A|nr:YjbF family lipoprotein [Pseudomonas sp. Hp2]